MTLLVLAKVTVLFGSALAFALFAKRAASATRHAVLSGAQLAALALPLLALVVPPLSFLPARAARVAVRKHTAGPGHRNRADRPATIAQSAAVDLDRRLLDRRRVEARCVRACVRDRGTSPSLPLDAYAGTYTDTLYGDMNVKLENGKLALYFAGHEAADLEHWHYNTFRVRWRDRAYEDFDTLAAFSLDASGAVRRMEMKLNRDFVDGTRK
ncbi:MAG: hypothetical protein DMF56_14430 [Acidobacteria bacterium]|nr:MAG: hypothetical protein DMF56_14430 [Acidobacteriota bacterium]